MSRPARARINIQALQHNLGRVRSLTPGSRIMAVIKANAYGHGALAVAHALDAADAFAVASLDEAILLREAGISKPVVLLSEPFTKDELDEIHHHRLAPVIFSDEQLATLCSWQGGELDIWIKIDTGMHRLGFPPDELESALARLRENRPADTLRVMSHLANADDSTDDCTTRQIRKFVAHTIAQTLERSLANSAGIVAWPESGFDWVRPGIMLYGASPLTDRDARSLGLEPVMYLESRVIDIRRCRAGEAVGYGGTYVCPEDMDIGVVAMGYGDGYPRHIAPGTEVWINHRRVPVVGRVSMDLITLDLRSCPDTTRGALVEFWGKHIPVDEVAQKSGTIAYELMCQVTPRVPRIEFVNES